MKEINATFKKKENLLRQQLKTQQRIIRNGKFVRGNFLDASYEGGRQAKKSTCRSSSLAIVEC